MIPKFRAWDKINKEMRDVWEIDFKFIGEILLSDDYDGAWSTFDDVFLMQSTGLKDKNGVEIYEGDVCNVGVNMWGAIMTRTGEVIFNEDDIQYQIMIEDFLTITGKSEFETSEVIGNIYENPERLEAHT